MSGPLSNLVLLGAAALILIFCGELIFLAVTAIKRKSAANPYAFKDGQPSEPEPAGSSGFPPGSVGDVSSRFGYDARDLIMAGFTHAEISTLTPEDILGVTDGDYSLEEMRMRKRNG